MDLIRKSKCPKNNRAISWFVCDPISKSDPKTILSLTCALQDPFLKVQLASRVRSRKAQISLTPNSFSLSLLSLQNPRSRSLPETFIARSPSFDRRLRAFRCRLGTFGIDLSRQDGSFC